MKKQSVSEKAAPSGCVRRRFEQVLNGGDSRPAVYAVYDWFVQNRPQVLMTPQGKT